MAGKLSPNTVVVAGLVAFVVCCASLLALYGLAPHKPDVAPLFAGIPGGVAALGMIAVAWVQRTHGQQLTTIGHNTNGELTRRINEAVASSVTEALAVHQVAVIPAQTAPHRRPADDKAGV